MTGSIGDWQQERWIPKVYSPGPIYPEEMVWSLLKTAGGSGDINADGSITPLRFFYKSPAGYRTLIHSLRMCMIDTSITLNGFASLAELTNGILLQIRDTDDTTVLQHFMTDENPITKTATLASLSESYAFYQKATPDTFLINCQIASPHTGICLAPGRSINIIVQDNLSTITFLKSMVTGYIKEIP